MKKPIRWTPGFRFDEIEWSDSPSVAKRQLYNWLNRQRKRCARIGREIAAAKERDERQEKYEAQLAREAEATARMLEGFRNVLRADAKKQHEEQMANVVWLEQARARLAKSDADYEKTLMRLEKRELMKRGVLRGTR